MPLDALGITNFLEFKNQWCAYKSSPHTTQIIPPMFQVQEYPKSTL